MRILYLDMESNVREPSLQNLESFFSSAVLPSTFQLGPGEKIIDLPKFINKHLQLLKDHPPMVVRDPHWDRLVKLYSLLSNPEIETPKTKDSKITDKPV